MSLHHHKSILCVSRPLKSIFGVSGQLQINTLSCRTTYDQYFVSLDHYKTIYCASGLLKKYKFVSIDFRVLCAILKFSWQHFRFTFNYQDASAVAETRLRRALDSLANLCNESTKQIEDLSEY